MGLAEGLKRLVILQRWEPISELQAKLSSNLDGVLPIKFYDDNQDKTLELMLKALEERKMIVNRS